MPAVREAVVDLLRELGMTTIFGNPGSTELPFFRAFPEDFRYMLGLQESVVVGRNCAAWLYASRALSMTKEA
jgi:benzoylformate decarboxylase